MAPPPYPPIAPIGRSPAVSTALNSISSDQTAAARCVELPPPSSGGGAPEWVELLPAGPEVEGRDGRNWRFDDAAAVAAASMDGSKELPIDWEHSTELKAPQGEPAPAAGWITALEARNGALWGKVEWTERGREAVASREYRYLSPVFLFEKSSDRILQLMSAGLTNSPNLRMSALNQRGQGVTMDIKKILAALGLAEDATEDQAVTAINTLKSERDSATEKAKNAGDTPSLEKFVPRADYDAACERATNAEAKLAEGETKALEDEIEDEIAKALEAGKITPATADYHREQCRQVGGLERFKKFVESAPEIGGGSGLGGKVPGEGATALNADATRIAAMFGHKAEDLEKYR